MNINWLLMSSRKSEVLRLYREILRLGQKWEGKGSSADRESERRYILNEARVGFRENKNLSSDVEIKTKLDEVRKRIDVAKHYGIPYPRPVYYGTGTITSLEKKKRKKSQVVSSQKILMQKGEEDPHNK